MTSLLVALCFDANDQVLLARSWAEMLGWPIVWDDEERRETAIRAPDGTGPFVTWGPPVRPKAGAKNRLHLDIAPLPTTINIPRSIGSWVSVSPGPTSVRAMSAGSSWPIP